MKNRYLVLFLSMFIFFACQQSEDNDLSALAKSKKEKFLQLVEEYEIEGYEVPASEEIWVNLDLEALEATYKKMRESKIAFAEREKKLHEIRQLIENADDPEAKVRELARQYPAYFIPQD